MVIKKLKYNTKLFSNEFQKNYLELISNHTITGLIIENVFNNKDLEEINENLLNKINLDSIDKYLTFPHPFLQEINTHQYLELNKDAINSNSYLFSLLNKKLSSIFKFISNNKVITTPKSYLPGTFRIIHPNECHIDLHCGNQFFKQFENIYSHLDKIVPVYNQLSFFTTLQNATEGGELEIFDAKWENYKKCNLKTQTLFDEFNNYITLEQHKISIKLNKGDLLIFHGGQYWHKVCQVYGKKHRITYGGFINFNKEKTQVYYWS